MNRCVGETLVAVALSLQTVFFHLYKESNIGVWLVNEFIDHYPVNLRVLQKTRP